MKIALGADHGGFELKEAIKKFLKEKGFDVTDMGPETQDSVDYNDYAVKVAEGVRDKKFDRGILVCGTGIGMSIMANKIKGIRAALVHDVFTAEATRLHNDSNVLTMGGRIIGKDLALKIVDVWVNTEFSGVERHERRVNKINNYWE
ncbi:MAG: ribose 5-phosphate isomerase B [Candidatus Izemoplasma sp.]|nr:ribose 5-phosphate isomerase B [Candidatus Izemoplasma sp.]